MNYVFLCGASFGCAIGIIIGYLTNSKPKTKNNEKNKHFDVYLGKLHTMYSPDTGKKSGNS